MPRVKPQCEAPDSALARTRFDGTGPSGYPTNRPRINRELPTRLAGGDELAWTQTDVTVSDKTETEVSEIAPQEHCINNNPHNYR